MFCLTAVVDHEMQFKSLKIPPELWLSWSKISIVLAVKEEISLA